MRGVEGGADGSHRVLDGNQGRELDMPRHLTDAPRREDDGMLEPQQLFLCTCAGKMGQPLKRCLQSMAQDKCSDTILKDRPIILLHVLRCPPIRKTDHVSPPAPAQFLFCNID